MKKKVLMSILIVVFLINSVQSISISGVENKQISFSFPDEIIVGEEFNANLILSNFNSDIYDVKFEIKNETINIAKVLVDNEWKSTYYWINDVINTSKSDETNFRLNISEEYKGINDVTVKIRDSQGIIEEFTYQMNIIMNEGTGGNPEENLTQEQDPLTYLEMEWEEDEIINGDEFNIKIKAFNLKDKKYDLKAWIKFKNNDTIISDRYDEDNDEWKSGNYYVNNFFEGSGNETKTITLKIRDDYMDFYGNAEIVVKLRTGEEIDENIKVLEKEEEIIEDNSEEIKEVTKITNVQESPKVTAKVIKLGSKNIEDPVSESEDIKSKNSIVYESNDEIIKKYSIYGFAFLCIILCILVVLRKLN